MLHLLSKINLTSLCLLFSRKLLTKYITAIAYSVIHHADTNLLIHVCMFACPTVPAHVHVSNKDKLAKKGEVGML